MEAGIVLQAYMPECHAEFEQPAGVGPHAPRAGRRADQGPHRQGRQPRDGDRRGPDPRLDTGAVRVQGRRRCLLQAAGRHRRAPGERRCGAHRDRQPQPVRPRVGPRGRRSTRGQRPDGHRDARGHGQRRGAGHPPRRRLGAAVRPRDLARRLRLCRGLPGAPHGREHRAGELPACVVQPHRRARPPSPSRSAASARPWLHGTPCPPSPAGTPRTRPCRPSRRPRGCSTTRPRST